MKNMGGRGFGRFFGAVFVFLCLGGTALAGNYTFTANSSNVVDADLVLALPDRAYGGNDYYGVYRSTGNEYRRNIVMFWNASCEGKVTSAVLSMYFFAEDYSGNVNVSVNELTHNFTENSVTWNKRNNDTGVAWDTPGGDYNNSVIYKREIVSGNYGYKNFTLIGNATNNLSIECGKEFGVVLRSNSSFLQIPYFYSKECIESECTTTGVPVLYIQTVLTTTTTTTTSTTTTTTTTTSTVPYLSVYLHSPQNGSNTTAPFDVRYNVSGTNAAYNCSAYFNGTWEGENVSVQNDTAYNLTVNMSAGTYSWRVNCSVNSTVSNTSSTWIVNVLTATTTSTTTTTTTTATTTTTTTTVPACGLGSDCDSCPDWTYINATSGNLQVKDADENGKYDIVCCANIVSNYTIL